MFYSKTTGGFYDSAIHGDSIPVDSVEISAEQHAALIEGQSQGKRIVADENGFPVLADPPPPTEAELVAEAWRGIKTERERRKAGGVKVGAKWFHSDDGSRIQQMGLVMMGANLPAGLQWKTMDGSFITMTPALAQQVFTGQAASDQAIFAVAEQHRVAMEASPDPAAYDFSTNWPKIFGE
jgi:hypothetical protein